MLGKQTTLDDIYEVVLFIKDNAAMQQDMDARFAQVDERFDKVDARFAQVDERFDKIDVRFDCVDREIVGLTETVSFIKDNAAMQADMKKGFEEITEMTQFIIDTGATKEDVHALSDRVDHADARIQDVSNELKQHRKTTEEDITALAKDVVGFRVKQFGNS